MSLTARLCCAGYLLVSLQVQSYDELLSRKVEDANEKLLLSLTFYQVSDRGG